MDETQDWTSIAFDPDLLPEEICTGILCIDCATAGFGGEDWQVSMPDSAFVLCIRNLVLHLANFGFTNSEIDDAIRVTIDCYKRLISPGNQSGLINDVEMFIEVVRKYAPHFSSTKLAQLVDYLQKDLIQHANLYKFCAFGERQNGSHRSTLTVDIPPGIDVFLPLKKGLKKDICDYEMKIKQLETTEQQEKSRLVEDLATKEAATEKAAKQIMTQKLEEWLANESPQQKQQNVLDVINAVAKQYASILQTHVTAAVENMELDLRYKLEKAAMPRPAKLGPPPRFKPKPAIQIGKLEQPAAAIVQQTTSVQSSKISSGKHK